MLLRLKLRLGAWMLLVGATLAAVGQLVTPWNSDPLTRGWFVSMGLIVLGTLALLYGITTYTQLSQDISLLGVLGSGLLALGACALLFGTVVLNMVVVPLLLAMAATIASVLNAPGSAVQSATNSVVSGLNSVGSFFGGKPSIPKVEIPQADGIQIISSTLTGLNLPAIETLREWGTFFSSGGPLIIGSIVLGLALRKQTSFSRPTSDTVIVAAGFNLLCQLVSLTPILPPTIRPSLLAISGVLLFTSLALLGATILFPQRIARLWSMGKKRLLLLKSRFAKL